MPTARDTLNYLLFVTTSEEIVTVKSKTGMISVMMVLTIAT